MIYLNSAETAFSNTKNFFTPEMNGSPSLFNETEGNTDSLVNLCREKLAVVLGIKRPDRIFFTSGAAEAFEIIINGLDFGKGKTVATFAEHKAVLRPLITKLSPLVSKGRAQFALLKCGADGHISCFDAIKAITPGTAAVFVNHCSNVTGAVQDIGSLAEIAHAAGALLIVDASQSAGNMKIDAEKAGIDILVFSGHKGLFGIPGTGGMYIRPGVEIQPLTSVIGAVTKQGLLSLCAGADFILKTGISKIEQKEKILARMMESELRKVRGVRVFTDCSDEFGPVRAFTMRGLTPLKIAEILERDYKIKVAAGIHDAPFIHRCLGTSLFGTVRASVSYFNSCEDVACLVGALKEISAGLRERSRKCCKV